MTKPVPVSPDVADAIRLLNANGYAVVKSASRRAAQRAKARTEADLDRALRDLDRTQEWGESLGTEARRLADRASFLYEAAIAHGATREELAGPNAPNLADLPDTWTERVDEVVRGVRASVGEPLSPSPPIPTGSLRHGGPEVDAPHGVVEPAVRGPNHEFGGQS